MRPICLEMNAFGPYADNQVIDFRDLKERKLFLIYGPTGSGKTTILDAMCYALYGDTSGNDRSGANMRSEYAPPEQKTYVKFTFAIGLRQFRVERSPLQRIAKKRGTGTKDEQAAATLYELNEDGTDKDVLATKYVEGKVNELLGFKSDQFRQVVLLPQGDFRRLLLAGSGERQEIMQVLFNTQKFGRIQELAKERFTAIEEQNKDIDEKINQSLQLAGVDSEAALGQLQEDLSAQQKQLAITSQKTLADRDEYQKTVQAAQVLASHWDALKKGREQLAGLQKQAAMIEEKRQLAEQLKKAQLLAEPCRNLDDIQAKGMAAGKALEEAGKQSGNAAAALAKAEQQVTAVEEKAEANKKDLEQITQLKGLREKAHNYTAVAERYEQESESSNRLGAELAVLTSQLKDTKAKIEAGTAVTKELQRLSIIQERAKADLKELAERVQQEKAIADLATTLAGTQRTVAAAKQAYDTALDQAHRDKIDYEAVQALFLQGQASVLARDLQDGAACPVCGATTHPQLAVVPEDMPEKEDVERRKAIADSSEKECQQQQVAWEKATATAKEQQRQYDELRRKYKEDGSLEVWQGRLADAQQAADVLLQKLSGLQQQTAEIQKLQEQLSELEKSENDLRTDSDKAKTAFAATEALLQKLQEELPEAYRQEADLQQAIGVIEQRTQQYDAAVKAARDGKSAAGQENARWLEQVRILTGQVQQLRDEYTAETQAVKDRVLAAGFTSVGECRKLQAAVPQLPELEQVLADHDKAIQKTTGLIEQEEKIIGTKAEPELAEYMKNLQLKNDSCDQVARQVAELKSRYGLISTSVKQIMDWRAEQGGLAEKYKTIGSVYDLVSGKTTGINFERYVLGALLDDVLNAANLRLDEMSRHRYQLQRSQNWDDRRVKRIGLDIEVFDGYTGYARPANTLSGGETFLASLSLALGLADVVQAYAGGIHLDTIFIDEGFGTLDADALDFALKALLELEKGGRLVGIISHVPELRERIDTRLAIHKTDRGSTVNFELL